MTTYKRVKFPLEVTEGKAQDLYRLKFIRRSEQDPGVRHFMKHSVRKMGHQLDVWYKEQTFTIGQLTKEQEKIVRSCVRLKKEKRRIQQASYVRYQEQVREKLQQIRTRLTAMRVLGKFRENARLNREDRARQVAHRKGPTCKIDFLRVPGNEEFMFGNKGATGDKNGSSDTTKKDEMPPWKHKMTTSATAVSTQFEVVGFRGAIDTEQHDTPPKRDPRSDANLLPDINKVSDINRPDTERSEEFNGDNGSQQQNQQQQQQSVHGAGGMAIFGQNVLPSASRMETIPEEKVEEVDVEIDDLREDRKLTKRRLAQFTRSQSKKNIFDENDNVPLLPEVSGLKARLVSTVIPPDTEDKQTQTSLGSVEKTKSKPKPARDTARIRKTIVVKLPRSRRRKHHKKREEEVKSSTGNYGSDADADADSDNDDQAFEDTDDYDDDTSDSAVDGYTVEADVVDSDDGEGWGASGDSSQNAHLSYHGNLHISLSYTPKTSSRKKPHLTSRGVKKEQDVSKEIKTHFRVLPEDDTFPEIQSDLFLKQNPRSMLYKERSFYVAPDMLVRPSGSAKYLSSRQLENIYRDSREKTEPEKLQEIKDKRLDDIQRKISREETMVSPRGNTSAEKGKSRERRGESSPPVSPGSGPKRGHRGNGMSVTLMNQKRAQASDWRKNHELSSSDDPVQRYERSKSGQFLASGPPVTARHEVPSLRDQYYRDKMLKAERNSMLHQNIKMKKFIDTFEKERIRTGFPAIAGGTSGRADHSTTAGARSSIGNFLFKICEPETDGIIRKKIVPSVSTTSLRSLRNCRYLREYTPMTEQDRMTSYAKETSWNMDSRQSNYGENYVANVRLQLF